MDVIDHRQRWCKAKQSVADERERQQLDKLIIAVQAYMKATDAYIAALEKKNRGRP